MVLADGERCSDSPKEDELGSEGRRSCLSHCRFLPPCVPTRDGRSIRRPMRGRPLRTLGTRRWMGNSSRLTCDFV